MPTFQPKIRNIKSSDKCRECKQKTDPKDLIITGIDESNYSITKNACKNPICRKCLEKTNKQ
jgi:hypothetical protein